MEHLSITFPSKLKAELDEAALKEKTKRSTLIQKAVRVYLALKRKQEMEDLLKEGYLEMSDEAEKMLEDFKALDEESLKHVD